MRRSLIFRTLFPILTLFFLFSAFFLLSIPKSIILDRLLREKGVDIVPERVEEGLLGVRFERVKVLFRNEPVGRLDSLRVTLGWKGVYFLARCGGGSLEGRVGFSGNISLKAKDFRCVETIRNLEGNLSLEGGRLFGNLLVEGLKLKGVSVDRVSLEFKGKRFEGVIERDSLKFKGSGSLELRPESIEESEVSGIFKGDLGNLILGGKLGSPTLLLR